MSKRRLQSYHKAWLSAHSYRDEAWLREKLKEGFDVHHIDGDHSNDDPLNLILIEATDNMRLHGMPLRDGIQGWRRRLAIRTAERRHSRLTAMQPQSVEFNDLTVKAYLSRIGRC